MSKFNGFGKAFVVTPVIALGVTNLDSYQSGQWVTVLGQRSKSRLVRDRTTHKVYILDRPRGSRLSIAALRLGVGVAKDQALTSVK